MLLTVYCLLFSLAASNIRLDGGCAAEDGKSASSLVRLLPPLLGPAPLFAEDMLDRSGELDVVRILNWR
jgi:hypothetical protein